MGARSGWQVQVVVPGVPARTVRIEHLPFHIGADPGCELTLEGEGLRPREAVVVLGDGARPALERLGHHALVPLEVGATLQIGGHLLVFQPSGPAPGGGDATRLLQAVLRLLPRLAEAPGEDHDGRLAALLEALVEGFGAEWGAFCERGSAQVRVHAGARIGGAPERVSRTVLEALDAAGDAVRLRIGGPGAEVAGAASIPEQIRSVIAAPLRAGPRLEGALYLESLEGRRRFDEGERAALGEICRLAGASMAASRRTAELEARGEALRQLHQREVRRGFHLERIVGAGGAMTALREQVRKASESGVTCLLLGESGTGKDLIARAIHAGGPRSGGPFVAVNCARFTPELAESELFGHARGAFTGASRDRAGCLELADGGVLFLDELGELPLETQPKLLRALETRSLRRLGEARERAFDVQLVTATNADLRAEVGAGRFREDLYFRLAVFVLDLPPLRERREDLGDLLESFLADASARHGRSFRGFSRAALELLEGYRWPGNVRELWNVVEQATIRSEGPWILPEDFTLAGFARAGPAGMPAAPEECEPLAAARERWERAYIQAALALHGGRAAATYEALGMSRANFYRVCKRLGIPSPGR